MRDFLFPGQGSQLVGMGQEAYIANGAVRDIFDRANDVLGYRLSVVMFEGPEEELRQTLNAQPAIFLHSYALYQLLTDPKPAMAAGGAKTVAQTKTAAAPTQRGSEPVRPGLTPTGAQANPTNR